MDPLLSTAITTVMLSVAVAAAAVAGWSPVSPAGMRRARFARYGGLFLITFGIAQGVGLGDELTTVGRETARESGWYEGRRPLQKVANVALISIFVGGAIWTWREDRRCGGWGVTGPFVCLGGWTLLQVLRVVSEHGTDGVLGYPVGEIEAGRLIEWACLVGFAFAIRIPYRPPARPHASPRGSISI